MPIPEIFYDVGEGDGWASGGGSGLSLVTEESDALDATINRAKRLEEFVSGIFEKQDRWKKQSGV